MEDLGWSGGFSTPAWVLWETSATQQAKYLIISNAFPLSDSNAESRGRHWAMFAREDRKAVLRVRTSVALHKRNYFGSVFPRALF